jgi:AraC family transcriptional regulator of adaptative response/methylated-DNA-[protein]-cysteine methyltransferase
MSTVTISMPAAATKPQTQTQDPLWQAVLDRNRQMDGVFFYAVKSTGIFCRPSCASKRPRREVVDFFFAPADAKSAGFRACKRCKPEEADPRTAKIAAACRFIDANLEEALSLDAIAQRVGLSEHHLLRVFKQAMGITPHEYMEGRRISAFKSALNSGETVASATYGAGFGSSSRVYERSNAHLGMTPAQYRKGAENLAIDYTLAETPLGLMLLAVTQKGICKLSLGDDASVLTVELRNEFPRATILKRNGSSTLQSAAGSVIRYLKGKEPLGDLPLDLRGTAFQIQVWKELQKLKLGQTSTYEEIAKNIGRPSSIRAVANAIGSNPVALVIPCHRVSRKDGSLGGYRWGTERKQKLLAAEARSVAK